MKRPNRMLTAMFVERSRTPGVYGDGRGSRGLSVRIFKMQSTGRVSKTWRQRIRINGKLTTMTLGKYPEMTLAQARARCIENSVAIANGIDPRHGGIPTFRRAAESCIRLHRKTWKRNSGTEKQWRAQLETYAFPMIGNKRVDKITSADVLGVLSPIWTSKPAVAGALRPRIAKIMDWSIGKNYRTENPAGAPVVAVLPKQNGRRKHHDAVHHREVPNVLAKVDGSGSRLATKLALRMIVLTACRVGEILGLRWKDVDQDRQVLTIPAHQMKTGNEHRVPMSDGMMETLEEARRAYGGTGLVFPSTKGKELNRRTFAPILKRLGIKGTMHGFRTSFRGWAEEAGVRRAVAERALAHIVPGVEGAYNRTTLVQERVALMQDWSDYCAKRD